MKHLKYTAKLEPIVFTGKGFAVTCPDVVIRNRVVDYITANGGTLTHMKPDYCIYTDSAMDGVISLTPIQFWLAAGELDRIQQHELVEASLSYLGSDSTLEMKQEEKLLWYIRDNREKVVAEMLRQNVTEAVEGYLKRRRQVLPDTMIALSDAEDLDDHILLDLLDDMIEQASQMEKHEMTAYLLEYKQKNLSREFEEDNQQASLEKELGFRERSEYDWMKLFDYYAEDDGIRINNYRGTDDLVFIPDEIGGNPVVSVHVDNFYADERDLQFFWQRPAHLIPTIDHAALAQAQPGDVVCFGMYPQTKLALWEPIEWIVLKKENDRLLVVSKLCLDKAPYHKDFERVSWETCHLRRWFNGPFYQLAFTPEEQDMIPEVTVTTADSAKYKTSGGADTQDHVFALSIEEAMLFDKDAARVGYTSMYHQVRGYFFGGKINCWWLRTPGVQADHVTLISNSGTIGTYGYRVDNNEYSARPAMWIQIGGNA